MTMKAASGLVCLLLVASLVQAQTINLSKTTSCKYLDLGYANKDSNTAGNYMVRIPVHVEDANDLVNYYLGQINTAQIQMVSTVCSSFKVTSEGNSNAYPSDLV